MEALDRMKEIVQRQTAEIIAALDPTARNPRNHNRKTNMPSTTDDPHAAPADDYLKLDDPDDDTKNDIVDKREQSIYHEILANQTPTCDTYALHMLRLQADNYRLAIQQFEADQKTRRHNYDAIEASRQEFISKNLFYEWKGMREIQTNIDSHTKYEHLVAALHNSEAFISEQTQRERRSEDIKNELRTQNLDLQTQNEDLREENAALGLEKKKYLANMLALYSEKYDLLSSLKKDCTKALPGWNPSLGARVRKHSLKCRREIRVLIGSRIKCWITLQVGNQKDENLAGFEYREREKS